MNKVVRWTPLLVIPLILVPLLAWKGRPTGDTLKLKAPVVQPHSESWLQGLGYIEPMGEIRKLVFKVNGVIARCPAQVGGICKKGDVLMELDNEEQKAEVALAESDLMLSQAERNKVLSGVNPFQIEAAVRKVESFKVQFEHCQKEHDRASNLLSRNSLSQSELDMRLKDLTQHEADWRQVDAELNLLRHSVRPEDKAVAEAKVIASKARLDLSTRKLEDTILRAPFDGCVLEILKREGEGSRLFDPDPVAIYADPTHLRVRAEVDERHVSNLSLGRKAVISGRALGERSYDGRIVLIKGLMGKKTVFSRSATERKDLDVLQLMIELDIPVAAPIGLEVDVKILGSPAKATGE